MTLPTSSSIMQEMKAVFAAVEAGSIGVEPLKVSTQSGRKYEVCYVKETGTDVWASTNGKRVRGYFRCKDCPEADHDFGIPGGDWIQITLKNGASPEPVVRLFEFEHRCKLHPETLDALATHEKCVSVFGSAINTSETVKSDSVAARFDVAEMLKKSEAYVTLNRFKAPKGDFRYAYPEDQNVLLECIKNILLDFQFQRNPQAYLDEWAQKRDHKEWTGIMLDDTARYFFDKHFEYSMH
jgi:hypothetical protein